MPGKVNPTQCEALSMLACQVMGNDVTINIAASHGHLQLNVFKPVIIHNILESIELMADGCRNFQQHCIEGLQANEQQMADHLENGLMLVTALNRHIGYDSAAKIAKKAYEENLTLRAAAIALGLVTDEQFSEWVRPRRYAASHAKRNRTVERAFMPALTDKQSVYRKNHNAGTSARPCMH